MAITKSRTQVEWSAADSLSIAAAGSGTSDAFTINDASFRESIMVKADNDGTPASGDYVDIFFNATLGDPDVDPDSADEYATTTYGEYLGKLDTFVTDPCIGVFAIPFTCKGGKLYILNRSAGRAITVSAQIEEQRG